MRLGISEPKSYIKKKLKSDVHIEFLESCCIGKVIREQIEAEVEEALSNDSWVDILVCDLPQLYGDSNL